MKDLYIENMQLQLYNNLQAVIANNDLEKKNLFVFGMDNPCFRTGRLLLMFGLKCSGYIFTDEERAANISEEQKKYAARFLRQQDANLIIPIISADQFPKPDNTSIVFIATEPPEKDEYAAILKKLGYKQNENYFDVLKWDNQTEFDNKIKTAKQLTLRDMQKSSLETLKFFRDFCDDNGLRYYICGGTLLGVVRHKGFIPWDDDVDVDMPFADYLKFYELFKETSRFKLSHGDLVGKGGVETARFLRVIDKNVSLRITMFPHRRVTSTGIDIFPLCGLPSDESARKIFVSKVSYAEWESRYARVFAMGDESVQDPYYKKISLIRDIYHFDYSEYVGYTPCPYEMKSTFKRSIYDNTAKYEFCGEYFTGPADYDYYLTTLYGKDYMIPPPPEKQIAHKFEAFYV
jgi:phosphorylcholine metabolism protein LicD